jgi:hypothetical protein
MTRPLHLQHDRSASRGAACAGAAWIDSGIAPGLVVVDSNRPSPVAGHVAGCARGLLKQFGAAH